MKRIFLPWVVALLTIASRAAFGQINTGSDGSDLALNPAVGQCFYILETY